MAKTDVMDGSQMGFCDKQIRITLFAPSLCLKNISLADERADDKRAVHDDQGAAK